MKRLVLVLVLLGASGCGIKAPPQPPVTQPGPQPAPKGVKKSH